MKFEIKYRYTGEVIFSAETETFKACVELAIRSKVNLSGSDLSVSDLRGSDLRGSNLRGSDLSVSDLRGSDLRWSNLRGSDLRGSDLRGSDLRGSDLSGSDLSGSNLRGSDLSRSDLSVSDLSGSDLSGSNLRGSNLKKEWSVPLTMLLDQTGRIRAYKLVNADNVGPFNGGITYEIGKSYKVPNANTDDKIECAEGINVATMDWCLRNWVEGYKVLLVEFEAKDIACIPIASDGKFRLFRCTVVGEKDISQLIPKKEEVKEGR